MDEKKPEAPCVYGDQDVITPAVDPASVNGGPLPVFRHRPDHSVDKAWVLPCNMGMPIPPGGKLMNVAPGPNGSARVVSEFDPHAACQSEGPPIFEDLSDGKGPAQVATLKYREGWDRTFGGKKEVGQA